MLGCCMKNITKMFSAQFWRRETSPWLFYNNSIKMTIQKVLAILNPLMPGGNEKVTHI